MKSRASKSGTVVSPRVRVGGRRARRVACRAGMNAAWRSERAATADCKFRYFVDSTGRQHFNFVQQIWLRPQIEMAVTPVLTVALETLAVNLLTEVTRRRDYTVAIGQTSRRVMQLAPRFCHECLLTAQADGWVIPRASVRSWLAAHSRGESRSRR